MREDFYDRVVDFTAGLSSEPDGRSWRSFGPTPLRIAFAVRLTSSRRPNKASVTLYNLSDDSVAFLERSGAVCSLKAGYVQANGLIASGEILDVDDNWSGTDRTTVVKIGDGEIGLLTTRFDASYAGAVTTSQILGDILAASPFGRGFIDPELPDRTYRRGVSFFGPASEALDLILDDLGAEWSIINGSLQVLSGSAAPNQQTGVLLRPGAGLKSVQRVKKGIDVTAYLTDRVWPGRPIRVESRIATGDYVARTVEHQGDSDASAPFETKIRAREIKP